MIQSILARWFREALASGKLDRVLGKRSSMRCDWAVPLEVRVDETILSAHGRDFSPRGVGFTCERAFEPGRILDLRRSGESEWVKIRIKHCSQSDAEFLIGAEFEKPRSNDDENRKSPVDPLATAPRSSDQIRREKRLRATAAKPPAR